MGYFEAMPESDRAISKSMSRFHTISWLLATCIPVVLLAVAEVCWPPERDSPATTGDWIVGFGLALLYFNVLYWVYDKHVNRAERPGCVLQLVFFGASGLVGGLLLIFAWDCLRWIQYGIMQPPARIKFCVSTPGFLYTGRSAQRTERDDCH